ncbi:MAG: response regulator [Proteobacteria bacterium]|nr:response regulator [Pseudomonadota bacterium]
MSRLRIFYVDNYRPSHRIILFSMNIRQCKFFARPDEMLNLFKIQMPDILIIDHEMEPFDGLEMTRLIREGEVGTNRMLPIIMFTARTTRGLVERARDSGLNGVIAKPASVYSVYTALSRVATERTAFVELEQYFGPDRRRQKVEFDSEERRSGAGRGPRQHSIGQKI